ncbi:LysR substrate-binding domain-containing protein [Thiocapsa rosea]|uniref:DNA-binding transcriptional LysR family regulator n=1 Tax=Thiocapsa rosea TaxID=69360 RepID=A0A495VCV6_9GAMM|nr:LysR substrate-binding domain-containing protein [Thiocapsa rosea]RKT47231.1 DNA-binding transcriptional LysR family regulator [Thiocapsa rosea]
MEQFEPNDLLIFAHVAEAGSFSRAAERIGLPKSTVSRRISVLEDRLGERLMLRTTRRLTLTELGEHLLAHARQVADEVDAVRALAEHRQARPTGRLRVSMPGDFATLLLSEMLAAYIARHPAVMLELDLSPRRVDLLGEGFDIAVRTGALPDDALLAARRLALFPIGLYAAPRYLAEQGDPAIPEDLLRHRVLCLVGRDGETAPWTLTAATAHWEGLPEGRIAANSPDILIRLAGTGAGIAAVPDCYAARDVERGRLRRVLPAWSLPAQTAWAVFPGRRLMPAKTRTFIDMLEAALGGAPGNLRPD